MPCELRCQQYGRKTEQASERYQDGLSGIPFTLFAEDGDRSGQSEPDIEEKGESNEADG